MSHFTAICDFYTSLHPKFLVASSGSKRGAKVVMLVDKRHRSRTDGEEIDEECWRYDELLPDSFFSYSVSCFVTPMTDRDL